MKILLIAGHGAGDPGACGYCTEADETRRVLAEMKSLFGGYDVQVDAYPTNRNAYYDTGNGSVPVNFANYDYVFEIHFNSASSAQATGVEVWVTPAESGISVEQLVCNKVAALGFPNRGVKREDFRVIRTVKNKGVSAALVEVCFVSNKGDVDRYNNNFSKVCKAMVDGIAEGFKIAKNGTTPPVAPPKPPTGTTTTVAYYVKAKDGKQLGAFNVLENAKSMAKANNAIVYDKNGKVIVSYVPAVSSEKRYAESGRFYFTTAVQIRTQPKDGYETGSTYYVGESVIYHHVILNKNGFNWIEYQRSNGTTGYIKIRDLSNGESYGYAV